MISLHTSPRDQPGAGDSGGMNVYVLSVARELARQGVAVDIFTRCSGRDVPQIEALDPLTRVIQVQSGPCAPVAKERLPELMPRFVDGVVTAALAEDDAHGHSPYDVVHSHYWLSGWVGERAKQIWGVPHVTSFHTLAKVKNATLPDGAAAEPEARLQGEQRVVAAADAILAPTEAEVGELVDLYGADPRRIRVVAPGVDGGLFSPRSRDAARARAGHGRFVLFVGRLQPLKGADVAVAAFARAVGADPVAMAGISLLVAGGPTDGPEARRIRGHAERLGVGQRVMLLPPQPQERLADLYAAAEMLLVPSRSESFGLVALEAQACGTPVVAAAVGGLRHAVADGVGGFLVRGHDPAAYARRILEILRDPSLAARLRPGAVATAADFSWEATATDIRRVYRDLERDRPA